HVPCLFLSFPRPPPRPTLFPYTTLFRSCSSESSRFPSVFLLQFVRHVFVHDASSLGVLWDVPEPVQATVAPPDCLAQLPAYIHVARLSCSIHATARSALDFIRLSLVFSHP